MPRAYDLRDHLGATSQVLNGFRSGDFYPRWLADFNDGWGEPTLVFYPPGLYFVSAALAALLGGDVLSGLFAALILFAIAGGLGAFVFVRRRFGAKGGLLAALAFGVMPFRVFEVYAAGLCSAFAAASLLPWALCALEDAVDEEPRPGARTGARAWPVLFAAIMLLNLPAAVLLGYLVAAWLAARSLVTRRVRGALRVAAGGAWGSLMAAVYLVPALAEMPAVNVPHVGSAMYRSHFLFQTGGSPAMSPGLQSMFDRMGIFPALAFVVSLGVLEAARQRGLLPAGDPRRSWALLVAITGGVSLFFATAAARWAWEWLPVLQRVNLPWRFLEPLSAAAACAAAAAMSLLAREAALPRTLRLAVAVFLFLLAGVTLAFDASLSAVNGKMSAAQCRAAIPQFARKEGYFLPKGARPAAEISGVAPLACDRPCRVAALEQSPARRRFRVVAPTAIRLAIHTYFFPGWTAERVDGPVAQPLATSQEPGTGRIVVELPAGESLVLLRFETTPGRRAGGAISVLAFLAWALWLVNRRRSGGGRG